MGMRKNYSQMPDDILKGFKVWPEPAEGKPYGPYPPQDKIFKYPHTHDLDVVLYILGLQVAVSVSRLTPPS